MPTLRALECLVAVADQGSVTEAARVLYLTQPAVSHQLALLEREAGTALLRRQARGVVLTPAGRAALVEARRAIEAAALSVAAARSVGQAAAGVLRLACAQSLVAVVAPVLKLWRVERPGVAVTLRESVDATDLTELVDGDHVDLAVVPSPVPDRFKVVDVGGEDFVLILPSDHPLTERERVRIADLEGAVYTAVQARPPAATALLGWRPPCSSRVRRAASALHPSLRRIGLGPAARAPLALGGAAGPRRRRSKGVCRSGDWARPRPERDNS